MPEIWYRYEDVRYASSINEFGESTGDSRADYHLREYEVLRHTPKGVWLIAKIGNWRCPPERFVLKAARKRYACPTKEEAMVSFLARKERQLSILRHQAKHVKDVIKLVAKRKQEEIRQRLPWRIKELKEAA